MSDTSAVNLPVVLVPGLLCSARLYAEQIPALWQFGPVTVADHTRDDTMTSIARRILAAAPPRFALAGLSMGGYIALEITRQAPERVARLALLDTAARAESPEQTKGRQRVIELAKAGRFAEVPDLAFPVFVHRNRHGDTALKTIVRAMAEEIGADLYAPDAATAIQVANDHPEKRATLDQQTVGRTRRIRKAAARRSARDASKPLDQSISQAV